MQPGRQFAAPYNGPHYQSGGIGHIDASRSVVGLVPVRALAPFREHAGDQNPGRSERVIHDLTQSIQAEGFKDPLMLEYDHRAKVGSLGEGNHRLVAAERLGLTHVPVRVYGRSRLDYRDRQGSLAGRALAPLHLTTDFGDDYVPPDLHPAHFSALR